MRLSAKMRARISATPRYLFMVYTQLLTTNWCK